MTTSATTTPASSEAANGAGGGHAHASFGALTLGSIGVVYGDIGTSPLYALREAVVAATASSGDVTEIAVIGVLSMILWALVVIVTLKYVVILLRADNNGEGGTLALMALAQRALGGGVTIVALLGIISGALFYGDAVITPTLSVLSAVEGVKVAAPAVEPPGRHHRRIFADPAGDPARADTTARNSAHLRGPCRSNLYAARQHVAVHWRRVAGCNLPLVERARVGLW